MYVRGYVYIEVCLEWWQWRRRRWWWWWWWSSEQKRNPIYTNEMNIFLMSPNPHIYIIRDITDIWPLKHKQTMCFPFLSFVLCLFSSCPFYIFNLFHYLRCVAFGDKQKRGCFFSMWYFWFWPYITVFICRYIEIDRIKLVEILSNKKQHMI